MTATRLWMIGCIGFAGLSTYLAVEGFGVGFNSYADHIRCNFVSDQRDTLFKLIPQLRPKLQESQIEAAAASLKLPIEHGESAMRMPDGIEFVLSGAEIDGIRSNNY